MQVLQSRLVQRAEETFRLQVQPQDRAEIGFAGVADMDGGCSLIGRRYFSLRQFTDALFSTVLDSTSMSKPLRNRYFNVSTCPVPSSETP